VFAPLVVIFTVFLLRKPRAILELVQALLAFSLALGLNGLVTDVMKLIVGNKSLKKINCKWKMKIFLHFRKASSRLFL